MTHHYRVTISVYVDAATWEAACDNAVAEVRDPDSTAWSIHTVPSKQPA